MKRTELTKFEFLFKLDENIVCQRFFNIKNYNPAVRGALDLYYCVADIADDIQDDLRERSIDFLIENQNFLGNSTDQNAVEYFTIEVNQGDDLVIARQFPANIYPPKVRYTVDLRPVVKNFISRISDTLTQQEFETEYLDTIL